MIARSEAEEHLRVIRSLMEKATIYRALSAPAALVGGLLSIGTAIALMWFARQQGGSAVNSALFGFAWMGVAAVTAAAGILLLRRDAVRRGEPLVSTGARSALRAILPPLMVAALITLNLARRGQIHDSTPWWITFYGLALLSMTHFAPRSLVILGWAFLLAGAASFSGLLDPLTSTPLFGRSLPMFIDGPCLLMAATFGVFHLVYAVCTWPRGGSTTLSADD